MTAAGRLAARALVAGLAALAPTACVQTVLLNPAGGVDGSVGGDSPVTVPTCAGNRTELAVKPVWIDVLIALDRSSSMNTHFGDGTGTRFSVVQTILQNLMTTHQNIHFGYQGFPADVSQTCSDGCCVDNDALQPGLGVEPGIELAMMTSGGCLTATPACTTDATPTAKALFKADQIYDTVDSNSNDGIDRYVLLITDGDPNCGMDSTSGTPTPCAQATSNITMLQSIGVKTIVVGVGENIAVTRCLDSMAAVGGATAGSSSPFYYQATSALLLENQLTTIMDDLAAKSCHVQLAVPVPDPSQIYEVRIDMVDVPRDPNNGWSVNNGSSLKITLSGQACATLHASSLGPHTVQVFTCDAGTRH
jgi:hypothetical protein